jgi:2-polyprenyl-3-methyl-5-hydroxy-6-metoxy-1,4-benzoquinol methylase
MTRNGAPKEITPRLLASLNKRIYARAPLSPRQTLRTIYRPLYTPFHAVLDWIPSGSTYLDVGCGTGSLVLLADALGKVRRGYGYDIEEPSLVVARAVGQEAPVVFDASTPVPAEVIRACNVISMVDTVHHVPTGQHRSFIRHFLELAAPGTLVIVKDLDPRPRWRAFANRVTDFLSTRSRAYYMAMSDVTALFAQSGFEVLEARRLHRHVWSHYLVVGRKR